MKRMHLKPLLLLSVLLASFVISKAQEKEKISPSMQLQYFKDNNDDRVLKSTLTYSKNRMELPVQGMKISFYSGSGNKSMIAEVTTDSKGVASFTLPDELKFPATGGGKLTFNATFGGNDTIEAAGSEITFKDMKLSMDLAVVDTVKTIILKALGFENGREIPLAGQAVVVYVPRMFSLLQIGEVTLDEKGGGTIEFPSDLPGDKEGNITILARIEEHPDYGNVEKSASINWGSPRKTSVPVGHRALWTKTAPRWMIYTLTILLAGVWGHYLFTIISLVRISRNAKKQKEQKI